MEISVVLSRDEVEGFSIVKAILRDLCDASRIAHRNAINYISVLLDDNKNKRICRLWFKRKQKYITILDENMKLVRYDISNPDEIHNFADLIKARYNQILSKGAIDDGDEDEK